MGAQLKHKKETKPTLNINTQLYTYYCELKVSVSTKKNRGSLYFMSGVNIRMTCTNKLLKLKYNKQTFQCTM